MKIRIKSLVGLLAVVTRILAACGGDSEDTTTTAAAAEPTTTAVSAGPTTTAEAGGSDLSGSIVISGSSTVEPISARVGEAFDAVNPGVATSVEGPGTGDGFARFCNNETDISDASRPIKDEEVALCEAGGIDYVELHVATDGTHRDDQPIE